MKKNILFLMMLLAAVTASAQDLVDRVSQAVGVELPSEYKGSVKAYVQGSKVLEGIGGEFTEQFITQQMKENWGINKQNQLLFIWDAIYEQVTKKNFYDGEDGNKQRLDDFEEAMDNIETCGKKYKQDYIAYMQQRSAEATKEKISQTLDQVYQGLEELNTSIDEYEKVINEWKLGEESMTYLNKYKQDKISALKKANEIKSKLENIELLSNSELESIYSSVKNLFSDVNGQISIVYKRISAEARQRSAEARQQSAEERQQSINALNKALESVISFYNSYTISPDPERLASFKPKVKKLISRCKDLNIDYKEKLSPEILKFYGIE